MIVNSYLCYIRGDLELDVLYRHMYYLKDCMLSICFCLETNVYSNHASLIVIQVQFIGRTQFKKYYFHLPKLIKRCWSTLDKHAISVQDTEPSEPQVHVLHLSMLWKDSPILYDCPLYAQFPTKIRKNQMNMRRCINPMYMMKGTS